MRTAQDIADYIEYSGLGEKARDVFTSADVGAYENRALFVTVKETQSSKAPDVTINSDYINVNIKIQGNYGKNGENRVLERRWRSIVCSTSRPTSTSTATSTITFRH